MIARNSLTPTSEENIARIQHTSPAVKTNAELSANWKFVVLEPVLALRYQTVRMSVREQILLRSPVRAERSRHIAERRKCWDSTDERWGRKESAMDAASTPGEIGANGRDTGRFLRVDILRSLN